jgi:hypothetical protein
VRQAEPILSMIDGDGQPTITDAESFRSRGPRTAALCLITPIGKFVMPYFYIEKSSLKLPDYKSTLHIFQLSKIRGSAPYMLIRIYGLWIANVYGSFVGTRTRTL